MEETDRSEYLKLMSMYTILLAQADEDPVVVAYDPLQRDSGASSGGQEGNSTDEEIMAEEDLEGGDEEDRMMIDK